MSTCEKCENAIITKDSIRCGSIDSVCQNYFRKHGIEAVNNGCHGFRLCLIKDYKLITNDRALKFMLAGKAEFKAVSGKTGRELFFRLIQKAGVEYMNDIDKKPHYLYWVFAGESEQSKMFAGTIYLDREANIFKFSKGINGVCTKHDVYIKAILYILNHFISGVTDINIRIYHNGYCGRCGRKLTKVQDITSGLEAMCIHYIDIPKVRVNRPIKSNLVSSKSFSSNHGDMS